MFIGTILGGGNTSVYNVADARNETIDLNQIRFYQNQGPIYVDNHAEVHFTSCCFTKFCGSGNSFKYISSDLISDKDTGCTFIIDDSCINYGVSGHLEF